MPGTSAMGRWLTSVGVIALFVATVCPGAFASSSASPSRLVEAQEPAEPVQDQPQEGVEGEEVTEGEDTEEEEVDTAPDAMIDPLIAKLIHSRTLIDKPRFSMQTGGKIQIQYFDSDSADQDNDDELILRRFRPYLMGHFATHWRWKSELELSSELTALDFDTNELDVRDFFVRYEGFEREGARLTLGNQKPPFSREFMHPSSSLLFVERTGVGLTDSGVPDRALGVHFRRPVASDKAVLWASLGSEAHRQDARNLRFESTLGASSELNHGWLAAGRLDLQPTGPRRADKGLHFEIGFAGHFWENDGSQNTLTEDGVAVDPERPDVDTANGLELSAALVTGGFTLDFQHNVIRARTVDRDFTGGVYLAGETKGTASTIQSGYWIHRLVQLAAGATRFDTRSYLESWKEWILGINFDLQDEYHSKLQITGRWIHNRFGLPEEDYFEVRIQTQHVW